MLPVRSVRYAPGPYPRQAVPPSPYAQDPCFPGFARFSGSGLKVSHYRFSAQIRKPVRLTGKVFLTNNLCTHSGVARVGGRRQLGRASRSSVIRTGGPYSPLDAVATFTSASLLVLRPRICACLDSLVIGVQRGLHEAKLGQAGGDVGNFGTAALWRSLTGKEVFPRSALIEMEALNEYLRKLEVAQP